MSEIKLHLGDCLEYMKSQPDNFFDSIVTDPPAGIAFMGKDWDKDKGGRDAWIAWMTVIASEAYRVLKPGAHALVWALPRTSHWTATAWEDAGFEVRDRVSHLFGSGFPKSHNISKAIDKMAGAEREVVGQVVRGDVQKAKANGAGYLADPANRNNVKQFGYGVEDKTAPATPEAQQWDGWGTALKPCMEDWWLLRKPIEEKTVAQNVLKHGTGAINIDASRVGFSGSDDEQEMKAANQRRKNSNDRGVDKGVFMASATLKPNDSQGRWPAQLIHDGSDVVLEGFPETKSGKGGGAPGGWQNSYVGGKVTNDETHRIGHNDSGSAARFFYCAKPSKAERDAGCEGMDEHLPLSGRAKTTGNSATLHISGANKPVRNFHPTVKAQALMRYLITLITPPNGKVLDPFMGSGSTGVAAVDLGFDFYGCDSEPEYVEIAKRRIEHAGYRLL